MQAKREFRNREQTEVAVLDALVDRNSEGMSVFELRSHADAGIDELETALSRLKDDNLISAEQTDNRTVIRVNERVIPDTEPTQQDPDLFDRLRDRIGL